MRWEKKLNIMAPILQAMRCLDIWLKEENKCLPRHDRARIAALMARYFQHEDEVTDQLMLSFLRHYSKHTRLDMEDPTSVRLEIKSTLDRSVPRTSRQARAIASLAAFLIAAFLFASAWGLLHKRITRNEEEALRNLVNVVAMTERGATRASIWADIKEPLRARRYQDMTWWQYRRAAAMLQNRIDKEKGLSLIARAGM